MTLQTHRLELKLMTAAFMRALLDDDHDQASIEIGYKLPGNWELNTKIVEIRLNKLLEDASLAPWQLRVIVLRKSREIVGHIGFHTSPGPESLAALAPGGIELGYSVFDPHRRQYYAYESATKMIEWAHTEHDVQRFIVSISPDNVPSLGLAHKLGFVHLESRNHPEKGLEEILELVYEE
jgi:RimJ/RimL family protein N-acetyltransferase